MPPKKIITDYNKREFSTFHQVHFQAPYRSGHFQLYVSIVDKEKHFVKKGVCSRHKLTYSQPLKFRQMFSQCNRKADVLLQVPSSNNVTL